MWINNVVVDNLSQKHSVCSYMCTSVRLHYLVRTMIYVLVVVLLH